MKLLVLFNSMLAAIKKKAAGNSFSFDVVDFLTKETVKMATLQFRVAAFIKCTPFELEEKSAFRVKMFGSTWKILAWHLANWIYSLQMTFLLSSLGWSMLTEPFGEDLAIHLTSAVFANIGWVFMTSLHMKPKECLFMLNEHSAIVSAAKDVRLKTPHWASHYFVMFTVCYFSTALLGFWAVQVAIFVWKPTSSKHIYAFLPLDWQESYAVFAAAVLHESAWNAWYLATLSIFFCYWSADVFTINDILARLTSRRMTTEDHLKLYRYLQFFCISFNDFNGSFFTVGFTTMLVIIPIVYTYLALTATYLNPLIYSMLPIIAGFCIGLIMFFLPQHSKVGILSRDLLKVLRVRWIKPERMMGSEARLGDIMADAQRRSILKKRIRALQPVGIRIWFFGIYTLQTSQELIEQLFNNIILLLSL